MHDIRYIREHPDAFDAAMDKRGLGPQARHILALDEERRRLITERSELQARRNQLAKEIGQKKKAGEDADTLMAESKEVNQRIKTLDSQLEDESGVDKALAGLPNILDEDVPDGADESDNTLIRRHGQPTALSHSPAQHFDIGEALGIMDFERAATISGSRFVILRGALARMERALASLMLDIHTQQFGYEEIVPPILVRDQAMFGTGQLPKFAEDSFVTTDGYWLIPTAEVPLTNLVAESIVEKSALPMRVCAYTPCFRSEAGAAGKDTRGMIRQHQFSKVELVSATLPEDSADEHERMLSAAETVLQTLDLPYRTMLLCSGDTGFGSQKTYDIEVWLPGQQAYREISSCSNFGAFQARRMRARFRREAEARPEFLHTLNGSGLALGRTMIAILENYQQANGSVTIPEALVPYMGGVREIPAEQGRISDVG